jgi:hypothetical protein
MTPEEKLCRRSWRLKNSLWVLPCILVIGMGNWAGWLYIGLKSKNRTWLMWAAAWAVWAVIAFNLPRAAKGDPQTTAQSIATTVMLAVWIAGMIQAVFTNRQWLRWRANNGGSWYGSPPESGFDGSASSAGASPQQVDQALRGTTPPALPPPFLGTTEFPQTAQVDINTASVEALQSQLQLPAEAAAQIVAERSRVGRFTSPEQLLSSGILAPHVYAATSQRMTAGEVPAPTADGPPSSGRRLEL